MSEFGGDTGLAANPAGLAAEYRRRGAVLRLLRRDLVIRAGTTMDVIEIDGATVLVYPWG
jgi:hypothetical protein